MQYYIAVIHQEEGSAYGAYFPDVAGCFAASDTSEELLAKASEALALYFEDQPLVPNRSMDALRKDPEVAEALASGAFLLAVPLIQLTGRTTKANITLDAGLLTAIDRCAKTRGLTRSAFLADLARREITAGS